MMSVGNRVYFKRPMPDPKVISALGEIPAANIADTMGRLCAMNPRIRLFSNPQRPIVAGPALTVKTRGGDNLMIHQALDMAQEGDVLIVSNEEDTNRALMGEIMFTYAQFKKLGALILDGPIRDIDAVREMWLPIYATGCTPGGPYKEGPGEINVPVACGGISVCPGDIVVADSDGVIVVPQADAAEVLIAAQSFHKQDAAKVEAAAMGKADRSWVLKTLNQKGAQLIESCYGER